MSRGDRRIAARKNARHLLEDGYSFSIVAGIQGRFRCNLPTAEREKRVRLNERGRNKQQYSLEYTLDTEIRSGLIYVQCDCRGFCEDGDCKHASRLWVELKKALPIAIQVFGTGRESADNMLDFFNLNVPL